jgi:dethiobiotin synthetase
MSGWFVTGTDTGVGKTLASQAILAAMAQRGARAVGMKPVASGCRRTSHGLRSDDAEALIAQSAVNASYDDVNPYAFEPAVAPHIASRGRPIETATIRVAFQRLLLLAPHVVVEGVGGWMVPIGRGRTMADVARALDLPVIMVVGMRLGCLNHALLTAAGIERCGLRFAGWIANPMDSTMELFPENVAALRELLPAPLLAVFPYGNVNPEKLASALDPVLVG